MERRNYDQRYSESRCKWALGTTEPSPHSKHFPNPTPKICNSILDAIGNTPIVRINNITKQEGITCELLVKCEFLNPGGSVKDRIGKRIIDDMEAQGKIHPGMTFVEPTSGNTGIGLAMSAAVKGYELIVCMPEKMSQEKSDTLKAMGSKIIRTPTEADFMDEHSYVGVAEKIEREDPNCVMAGQYFNPSNPLTHYDITAEEIYDQLDGKLDYLVLATGTGGHMTGLSRKLKEKIPNLVIVGVDPFGSIVRDPENAPGGSYKAEGMGSGIIPRSCYTCLVDRWFVTHDKETFEYARKLIRHEGLLVGGSAGAVFWAAVQVAKELPADKRVLTVIPDGLRNYMSKFLNDRWMIQNGFLQEIENPPVVGKTVRDLEIEKAITCSSDFTVRQILQMMKENKISEIPVIENGIVIGVASSSAINKRIIEGFTGLDDNIRTSLVKVLKCMKMDTTIAFVNVWLEDLKYAVVHDGDFIGLIYPTHVSDLLARS
ncbi:hypothetical protein SteCoe_9766 [Stentor coeruleus]|uniref:cystathionine beta-synthase n=1 Tax=Stentor coeruleus TaxID=5963 RepID=A0A1R2CH72_9CILI|nr:hypothetical protein SteCoe_9766 [Stentor coeruleus]